MGSTFSPLEIGKRGLAVHQTALSTTGHNISNADNQQYSRQRVTMESMEPLYDPSLNRAEGPGQIGQGARVANIERIRDSFYDDQIAIAENQKNYWEVNQNYLNQMEKILNEPSDNTLRTLTDNFWASWQDVSNFPSDIAHRNVTLERAQALTTRINDTYNKLADLRIRADREVQVDVQKINTLGAEIRDLNEKILKLQALGDNPNDLMDRRDVAVEQLAGLANINIGRGDRDELIVFIGEQALVQGVIHRKLKTQPNGDNEGMHDVLWEHNDRQVVLSGGHLLGLINVRDKEITERIDQVDLYATNLHDIVNEVHKDGFGLNGKTNLNFFQMRSLSSVSGGNFRIENGSGNADINGDGTPEVTAIFRVTGTNTIDPDRLLGMDGTLTFVKNDVKNTPVRIDYRRDETLKDVIKKINDSGSGVVAYMNHDSQLALKSTVAEGNRKTNFMIRHLEDSGDLLTGFTGILAASGPAGAFDYSRINDISKLRAPLQDISLTPIFHPSAFFMLSDDVKNNPASLAAGRGKDIGGTGDYNKANGMADGNNALLIAAALKQNKNMIGHADNPEEFYNGLISKLGAQARKAEDAALHQKENLLSLNRLRQSTMGVSLDEEMANMVQFQHSYNAAAKIINTYNEMLGTIIRLGT